MKRVTKMVAGTAAVLLATTAISAADTSSVPVSVGVVEGQRSLQVTGSDGTSATGPAVLSFQDGTTQAPLGVIVSDVTYERVGYTVDATLTDLFQLSGGTLDCNSVLDSSAFSVQFGAGSLLDTTGINAAAETLLTFTDTNITEDLVGISLGSTIGVTVSDVPGLITDLSGTVDTLTATTDVSDLTFMNVNNGGGDLTFDQDVAHSTCTDGARTDGKTSPGTDDSVQFQFGQTNTPDLTSFALEVAEGAEDTETDNGVLSPTEAVNTGLLPSDATDPGGVLYEATADAIEQALLNEGVSALLISTNLAAITVNVLADLTAQLTDLVLNVVGQTGVYTNLPTVVYNPDAAVNDDVTTGLYNGTMTVTLTDQ